jgi:VWFA-related protein
VAAAPQDQPLIQVTSRLIEVSVVVQEDGKPVSGLTQDDFELFEEGKPREIAFFSADSTKPSAPAVTLPPNAFSNRMAATSGARNATVILFDGLNTEIRDQIYAKNQVIAFLEQIQPEDHVAIFVLGQELHVLHDFTSDSRSLLAALEEYKGRIATELRASQSVAEVNRQSRIGVDPTQPGFAGAPGVGDPSGPLGGGGDGAALLEQIFREFIAEANRRPSDFYTRQRGMWTARAV